MENMCATHFKKLIGDDEIAKYTPDKWDGFKIYIDMDA